MISENHPYSELEAGMSSMAERLCRAEDLFAFAHSCGNHSPMHLADRDGDGDGRPEATAPGMWCASLISGVIGSALPGPGTELESTELRFHGIARAGETLRAEVEVAEMLGDGRVRLAARVLRKDGETVVEGTLIVRAPSVKRRYDDGDLPPLTIQRHIHFDRIIAEAHEHPSLAAAVACPESTDALEGALLAARAGLMEPVLVGRRARILAAAEELGEDISEWEIVEAGSTDEAAARAVALVAEGRATALMKGHLHTDELLRHVVKRDGGLRGRRRLSHVFVMDVPGTERPLLITDAAINIAPTLEEKVDIVQNAIDLARALGIEPPRVAVLSAIETVNPRLQSSMDAAMLAKMADRGQIKGGLVDGPLAMDNALNLGAAKTKGISGEVAGRADVLVAPNLDAANMIAKELTFLAHAEAGGIVLGARCPIILTSRADDEKSRLASCALASLHAAWMSATG